MVSCYDESRVVFDNYLDQSLKNKTRQKRAVSSTEYEINLDMKLTVSLKEILSSSRTKQYLTEMFARVYWRGQKVPQTWSWPMETKSRAETLRRSMVMKRLIL